MIERVVPFKPNTSHPLPTRILPRPTPPSFSCTGGPSRGFSVREQPLHADWRKDTSPVFRFFRRSGTLDILFRSPKITGFLRSSDFFGKRGFGRGKAGALNPRDVIERRRSNGILLYPFGSGHSADPSRPGVWMCLALTYYYISINPLGDL